MGILDNMLADFGNIGNALGIQGDNPAGYNGLQRMEVQDPRVQAQGLAALATNKDFQSADPVTQQQMIAQATNKVPNVQQIALAKLPQDKDFQAMDVPTKQAKIASITGDPKDVEGAISASALKGIDLNDPDLIPNMIKTGNTPGLDALSKLNPLLQTRQLQLIANSGQPQPAAAPSQPAVPANSTPMPASLPPTSGESTKPNSSQIINNTLGLEGGAAPSDGASNAPVIFGINAKAHPAEYAQAKQINDTQGADAGKAYAQNFYQQNYWNPHKDDLESLDPKSAQIAYDALVNNGDGFGNQVIGAAKAGASPQDLIDMRNKEYGRLAAKQNPDGSQPYAASLPGWQSRMTKLQGMLPSLGAQQSEPGQGFSGMAGKLPQGAVAPAPAPQQELNPITNQPYQPGEPHLSPNYTSLARKSSALTSVMGVNGDQARAAVQDKESEPSYVAWKDWMQNQNKMKANIQEKQGGDNIDYNKEIHDDAQNAIHLNDSLGEMANLRKDFVPGKVTPAQALIAQWKIGLGMGSDADAKMAASAEGEEKLAIQNVTGQLKQLSSRPSQMEFIRYLDANPNIAMTPQGFDTILQYMKTQANLPLQKEQEFSVWKGTPDQKTNELPSAYRDFDTQWDKKLLDTQSGRMVSPQGNTPPQTQNEPITKRYNRVGGKLVLQ